MINWIENTKENRAKFTQHDENYNIPQEYYSFALLHKSKSIFMFYERFYDFTDSVDVLVPFYAYNYYGQELRFIEIPLSEITHFALRTEYEAILPKETK